VIALVIGCSNFDAVQAQVFLHMGYVNANPRDDSGRSVIAQFGPGRPPIFGAKRRSGVRLAVSGLSRQADYLETRPKFAHGRVEDGHAPHPIGDQNIEGGIACRPMQERAITAVIAV
jgi:hypothetical protein